MTIGLGQFHEQQKLVTVAQSIPGKIGVWIAAIGLLIALDVGALMMVALTLVMFFPRWRKALLSLVAIGVLGEGLLEFLGKDSKSDSLLMLISGHWLKLVSMTAAAVALMYVIFLAAHRFTRLPRPIRQFPVLTLHGAIWLGLFLSPLPGLGVLSQSPFIIWRLSYLWLQASRGRTADTRFSTTTSFM